MASDTHDAGGPSGSGRRLTYRRDAVSLGPFAKEPDGLWQLIYRTPAGVCLSGEEFRAEGAAWLLGALWHAGVDPNAHDRALVRFVFEDCDVHEVQVVAGWIARARPADPSTGWDRRRASVSRLLDALENAAVDMGAYDLEVPGFLAEDCGTPAVRAVTRWLGRVRPPHQPEPTLYAVPDMTATDQPAGDEPSEGGAR